MSTETITTAVAAVAIALVLVACGGSAPAHTTALIAVDAMLALEGESILVSGLCDGEKCTFAATDGTAKITLEEAGLSEDELTEFDLRDPDTIVDPEHVIGRATA